MSRFLSGGRAFLVVLGGLLFWRVWMFQRFDAIKQTKAEELPDNQPSQLFHPDSMEQYPF